MLGELISAGASLLGGFLNRNAQEENNQRQIQHAQAQLASQEKWAQANLDQQREFAQHGLRWKVADAQAAGLHPLAAIGAQTTSFSPISVGSTSLNTTAPQYDFDKFGQNIGRAIDAGSTQDERTDRLGRVIARIGTGMQLERAALENEQLKSQIALTRSQIPPAFPLPRPGPDRTVSGLAVEEDNLKQKPEDHPATKIVRPFGYALKANPWFNDGQQFEDRYGDSEIGSTIKFGVNTLADHYYTFAPSGREIMDYASKVAQGHKMLYNAARGRHSFKHRFHF